MIWVIIFSIWVVTGFLILGGFDSNGEIGEREIEIAFWWPLYFVKWMTLSFFRIFK